MPQIEIEYSSTLKLLICVATMDPKATCFTLNVKKLTLAIKVLNLWSNPHTESFGDYLISFNFVMHYDSYFVFLDSSINPTLISTNTFQIGLVELVENFMYHSSAQPLKVMIIWAIFMASSCTCWIILTASQRIQCCSRFFDPFPLKRGNFISSLAILCLWGTEEPKIGDVILGIVLLGVPLL